MSYFFGIDGGGTKTDCAVGDDARQLGRAVTGSAKVNRVGEPAAREALQGALAKAAQSAGIALHELSAGVVGIAGGSSPGVVQWVKESLGQVVKCPVEVVGDNVIAQHDAFGGGPGILVISGTGSIAFGLNEKGESARAGGWGSVISDEGSGDWMGRKAVAAVMRAYDSGQKTALLELIYRTWNVASHDEIVGRANAQPRANFAQLAPGVLDCEQNGDKFAREIVRRAGSELAQLAIAVARKLFPPGQTVRVAVSGGVLLNSPVIQDVFESVIKTEVPEAIIRKDRVDAAAGALAMARMEGKKRVA